MQRSVLENSSAKVLVPLPVGSDISTMQYRKTRKVTLSKEERARLVTTERRAISPLRDVLRARIILAAAEGLSNQEISERLGISIPTAARWRERFLENRIAGLQDRIRTGAPRRISDKIAGRVILLTLMGSPPGERWSLRTMARAAGVTSDTVARIWNEVGLKPHRKRHFEAVKRSLLVNDGVGLRELAELNAVALPSMEGEALRNPPFTAAEN